MTTLHLLLKYKYNLTGVALGNLVILSVRERERELILIVPIRPTSLL